MPDVRVSNLEEPPLPLLDGEQLVGAKQNRILKTTALVAAQSEVTMPASCVERGRCGYRARHSVPSEFSLYAGLRAKKSACVIGDIPSLARPVASAPRQSVRIARHQRLSVWPSPQSASAIRSSERWLGRGD